MGAAVGVAECAAEGVAECAADGELVGLAESTAVGLAEGAALREGLVEGASVKSQASAIDTSNQTDVSFRSKLACSKVCYEKAMEDESKGLETRTKIQ